MPTINTRTCASIQCGATSYLEAGMQEIMDCSAINYGGVRSCLDPLCVGALAPKVCNPDRIPPIPFSPANDSNGYIFGVADIMQPDTQNMPDAVRSMIGEHDLSTYNNQPYYQDMVMCPNGETGMFMMGMDSWKSLHTVAEKVRVMGDLPMMELLGFLAPAVVIGYFGYQFVKRG